ncbi:hypothetical protein HMPREF9503_00962 [Enterococcus faecalis TX0043]|nr:hypothetical protein HMPREF9503_00962 [Enterococcus faecalis TX0043]
MIITESNKIGKCEFAYFVIFFDKSYKEQVLSKNGKIREDIL